MNLATIDTLLWGVVVLSLVACLVPVSRLRRPVPVRVSRERLPRALYLGVLLAVLLLVVLHGAQRGMPIGYGAAVTALLAAKMWASTRPIGVPDTVVDTESLHVVGVVPFYNEDPVLLVDTVRSFATQTRPPDVLYVVDDGSTDGRARAAVEAAVAELDGGPEVVLLVADENRGKRHALALAFRAAPDADVYVTVDSDTLLELDAVAELVAAFADPRVVGATGLVLARNHAVNMLTRLIDLRYATAFLYERAAYSSVGSVLCACGSLAAWRGDVVHENLEDFLGQQFLGQPAVFGDDRRMTNYALQVGRVVLADRAVAHTAVPERVGHYLRQQVRWNKSFFRESWWVLLNFPLRSAAFWMTFTELASWLVFTAVLMTGLFVLPAVTGATLGLTLLAWISVMAWIRSLRFLEVARPDVSRGGALGRFLLSPLYGALSLAVLLPLRLWSLATLTRSAWGTRESVEVSASSARTAPTAPTAQPLGRAPAAIPAALAAPDSPEGHR